MQTPADISFARTAGRVSGGDLIEWAMPGAMRVTPVGVNSLPVIAIAACGQVEVRLVALVVGVDPEAARTSLRFWLRFGCFLLHLLHGLGKERQGAQGVIGVVPHCPSNLPILTSNLKKSRQINVLMGYRARFAVHPMGASLGWSDWRGTISYCCKQYFQKYAVIDYSLTVCGFGEY